MFEDDWIAGIQIAKRMIQHEELALTIHHRYYIFFRGDRIENIGHYIINMLQF